MHFVHWHCQCSLFISAGLCAAYEASCSCSRWPGHHGYQGEAGVLMVKRKKKTTTVVFCQSRFRIRILLSLFFFCHDLWRCVSVSINFQATFGSSQALRQLPGLNSAGKRSASSVSICAADVLINISCCLLDLSSELHNSRSGPSTLSLPRCTELKSLDLKTSSSIQIRKCENVWVQIVAMFLSQTVTVLGLPSLRQELKELEEQREQRRPEVEVNTGPG